MCIMIRMVWSTSLGTLLGSVAGGFMDRLLESGAVELLVLIAIVALLAAVVIYVVGLIRVKAAQQEPTATELLSKFRESHSRGELSDTEFRTIRTTLGVKLQEELRDNGERG